MNKKKEEKKNRYHKEHGLWSNASFMVNRAVTYDKAFLWMVPLGVILGPVIQYLWTFISKFVIDLITGEGRPEELFWLIAAFMLIQLVATMLNTLHANNFWWRCIRVRLSMMNNEKNYKAMRIPFEHLEDPEVMDCFERAGNACNDNNKGIEGMLHRIMRFLTDCAVVACGLCILGSMDLWIILMMLVFAGISFFVSNRTGARNKEKLWDPMTSFWRKRYYVQQKTTSFDFAKDIRMFHIKDWLMQKFHALNLEYYETQKKDAFRWLLAGVVKSICWAVPQAAVYGWLIYAVLQREITLGNFTLYVAAAGNLFQYISQVMDGVKELLARSREVDDFRSFLELDNGKAEDGGVEVPWAESYEFRFENVSFQYPRAEQYALRHLNLTLKAGERLAVVGLNGAGKSTFIKLLLRLYEPTEGTIYLNGVDIRTYNRDSYYKVFAPVFQEVQLFAFPLAENISMKPPKETDKELAENCLFRAGFEKKLAGLPKGVSTEVLKIIHDDGVDFSGGEKQKIALARALYKQSPVVVLDEPTAALDALAEYQLYQDFDKLIGGKTAVYISHRLSSTRFCDNVAMFRDGEMVEYGTHQELLSKGGAYAEMFEVQAQYYVDETGKEAAATC